MEYHSKCHSVYLMTYHLVFVTKYRRPVISDGIGDFMERRAAELCAGMGGKLISGETGKDHIHLLVDMPPQQKPSDVVRVLKTQLSRETRAVPEYDAYISKYLLKDALWQPSYFIATTGTAVLEKVKEYIDSQRTDGHKRKYEKTGRYIGVNKRKPSKKA